MASHRRGPWSNAEDSYLMQLVQTHGPLNWVRIAQTLGSRTPKQCRERYHQNLKPTLNHDPITPEEGVQIERLVREIGKRWAEIARRLNGRSDNAVKNWWNGSQNRRKRLDRRRTAQSLAAYDDHYPLAAMSMTLGQPPGAHHRHAPSPSAWRRMTLLSPCISEIAESEAGSNYITSPVRSPWALHSSSFELPRLQKQHSPDIAPAPLPSLSSWSSTSLGGSRLDLNMGLAPRTTQGQLLTAPSSPTQHLEMAIRRQWHLETNARPQQPRLEVQMNPRPRLPHLGMSPRQQQQRLEVQMNPRQQQRHPEAEADPRKQPPQDDQQRRRGSDDRDARMNLSSLLI